jgi:hypothetical protein
MTKWRAKMPKVDDVSVELVKEYLSYDAETGIIYWKKSPSKNVYGGEVAGCNKATRKDKDGNLVSYGYIRFGGQNIPSARIAWVLIYGEWPNGRVKFSDGNQLNLKAENLLLSQSLSTLKHPNSIDSLSPEYYREHRKAYKTEYSDKDLQRKYGISLLEYSQLFMSQGGKCAICNSDYGGHRNGEQKALAVDHCHTTGKVRGLLCESCNQGIGKLKDDVKILQSAIRYLTNPGSLAPSTGPADTARMMGRNLVQEEGT